MKITTDGNRTTIATTLIHGYPSTDDVSVTVEPSGMSPDYAMNVIIDINGKRTVLLIENGKVCR